jgi:competence protein ComEC
METKTRKLLVYLILPLTIAVCVVFSAAAKAKPDFLMHVDFLDVGQGDSIFIETYLGTQILIDGGPGDLVVTELSKQMPFYDRSIDLLILTHPDADHVSGLSDILKRYKVKKVLMTDVSAPTATYNEFLRLIEEKNVEKIHAQMGERIWLDNATVFDVYYPPDDVELQGLSTNNTGIIGKLIFGKTEILFTADADSIVEDLIRSEYDLSADILKVGHHGSKHSNSMEFIKEVNPQYGVIQVGAQNNYGHPTKEAMDNLRAANVKVFRTDLDGTVEFTSDGTNLYKK